MNYIVNFENCTTTNFKSKRELAAVVVGVRANGEHAVWSKHASRAAATKFTTSAVAARVLDYETIHGLRENMHPDVRARKIREHEREATDPRRPIRFYVADAVAQS